MSVLDGHRLVPLAAPADAAQTEALAEGLVEGGVPIVEVALRTEFALEALRRVAADGRLVVGAGTVLDADQARAALDAGAQFLVSPGLSVEVVRIAQDAGVPVLPGVLTPSEVMAARDLGLDRVKLFPASVGGGRALLDAHASVFRGIRFMPSGGVSPSTVQDYLAHPAVFAVSGSWIASSARLDEGASAVAATAEEARRLVDAVPV